MLIGLTGRAGSGKSTVAAFLYSHGFQRHSFAAPLKALIVDAFELPPTSLYGTQTEKETPVVAGYSGRQLAQRIGTAARKHLGEGIWYEACLNGMDFGVDGVIEDLRYLNEAAAIKARGGVVWRLICPDRVSSDPGTHPSEAEVDLIKPDLEIVSTRAAGDLLTHAEFALQMERAVARAIRQNNAA